MTKPGKLHTIAIYTLILGIWNLLAAVGITIYVLVLGIATCGIGCLFAVLIPLPLITGIMEIMYATKILPDPIRPTKMGKTVAILEIANVVACNLFALAGGIASLVLYGDPDVKAYMEASSATRDIPPGITS